MIFLEGSLAQNVHLIMLAQMMRMIVETMMMILRVVREVSTSKVRRHYHIHLILVIVDVH